MVFCGDEGGLRQSHIRDSCHYHKQHCTPTSPEVIGGTSELGRHGGERDMCSSSPTTKTHMAHITMIRGSTSQTRSRNRCAELVAFNHHLRIRNVSEVYFKPKARAHYNYIWAEHLFHTANNTLHGLVYNVRRLWLNLRIYVKIAQLLDRVPPRITDQSIPSVCSILLAQYICVPFSQIILLSVCSLTLIVVKTNKVCRPSPSGLYMMQSNGMRRIGLCVYTRFPKLCDFWVDFVPFRVERALPCLLEYHTHTSS